jgi:hypothetical protein
MKFFWSTSGKKNDNLNTLLLKMSIFFIHILKYLKSLTV